MAVSTPAACASSNLSPPAFVMVFTSWSFVAKEELSTRLRCSSIASRFAASESPSRAAAIAASVAASPDATAS